MMTKMTAIYNSPVGLYDGQSIPTLIYFEAPSKCSTNELYRAINEAGYKTQKPGKEWDICDAVSFIFYGHVEHVR